MTTPTIVIVIDPSPDHRVSTRGIGETDVDEETLVVIVEDIIWQRTTLDHEWCGNLAKAVVSAILREIDGNMRED